MATKNYYVEYKEIFDEINKELSKSNVKFRDWAELIQAFANSKFEDLVFKTKCEEQYYQKEHKGISEETLIKIFRKTIDRAKQRALKKEKASLRALKTLQYIHHFMRQELDEYIPLKNTEFHKEILGKEVLEQIEDFRAE